MAKIFSKTKVILVVILLAASFLRLWKISVNPVSLFGDELDLGYQAYSILQTGRDYTGNLLPIHFHSLAEWRTPLYLYSAVPTVAIWGITPLGVRLPAAIFGILSVLMMYLFVKELLSYGQPPANIHPRALLASALMAINPWSLQYSRAGFEVTMMLFLLLLGLWLFFKALKNGKWLWLSVFSLTLTPWVYSTAKLFTPLLLIFLFIIFRKEILSLAKKYLVTAVIAGLIAGLPIAYSTLFGGGTARFDYVSVFTDPTTVPEIGFARQTDAKARGETGTGLSPTIADRLFHNKFTGWGEVIISNYLQAYSTDFLFVKGDPDPRQSVGIGEIYRIEIIPLLLGLGFFFFEKTRDKKIKLLMGFWFLAGAIPSAITRDGGNHATRLILILPPLIFFISFGWMSLVRSFKVNRQKYLYFLISGLYLVSFAFYIHKYYVHYPYESERWWHYGWGPAISEIKSIDPNYDRVIISMSGEPAWIFFAGWYQYPPATWQKEFSPSKTTNVPGFGDISYVGKFYFGTPSPDVKIYGLGRFIDSKTLYLANASEMGANLIIEPVRVPEGLKLIKTIAFPSGEPAFYLFSGEK